MRAKKRAPNELAGRESMDRPYLTISERCAVGRSRPDEAAIRRDTAIHVA